MTDTSTAITNANDIIDVRDVIARIEYLEGLGTADDAVSDAMEGLDQDEANELESLRALLDGLRGNGGDHQHEGDWYPVTLIRDSYFEDYARELAEDIGAIPSDAGWPAYCIDWERAARELQMDYTSVDFDGVDYWTR